MADDKSPDGPEAPGSAKHTDEISAALEAAMEAVDAVKSRKKGAEPASPKAAEQVAPDVTLAEPAAGLEDGDALSSNATIAESEPPVKEGEDVEALRAELEDWKARAYRTAADLENVRRRGVREKEDLRKFAIEGLLKDILPVVDNLQRAVTHAVEEDPLAQGVQMVLKQFTKVVGEKGATSFDPQGDLFDPNLHEAMTQMPTNDVPPGHVAQVFQRGWMLHDRLVRPAMVVVASAAEEDAADDSIEDATPVPAEDEVTPVPIEDEVTPVPIEDEVTPVPET